MISEAAYYRAQARGFQGGDPLADWVAAEVEIDRTLRDPRHKDEQAAYERLRAEVQKALAAARDSVDAQTIQDAIDRAATHMRKAGAYASATVSRAAEGLKKDIANAATIMGPRWEAFSDKTAGVFAVWRDRGGEFLAQAARSAGEWLNQTGQPSERPHYRAGDMVGSGEFACLRCDQSSRLETSGHLAPCQRCGHNVFRRLA
jgi:DNA-directed RNA polymerase subunit RPC12/RpoP